MPANEPCQPSAQPTESPRLLVVGWVWPEPNSSAAGQHILSILGGFRRAGFKITFACAAQRTGNEYDLSHDQIECQSIQLNCSSFDDFVKALNPSVVLFDRFMMEEQFGWRVEQSCPDAVKILDTEDLQCLRNVRHEMVKRQQPLAPQALHKNLMQSSLACREIASILRCDLSLIISEFEHQLLIRDFNISPELLHYLPFAVEPDFHINGRDFNDRQHMVTIGNFRHPPNWDSLLQLQTLWPAIRARLPHAELHIYGAYTPPKAQQLHNPKKGILIKGQADDAIETLSRYRLCIAPLRFGAGLKGKLLDAMLAGTPSVTSSLGAEGMSTTNDQWPGGVEDDHDAFIDTAVALYEQEDQWRTAHRRCESLVRERFANEQHRSHLFERINALLANVQHHRNTNFTGRMLRQHNVQSTRYMSQWIEAKNRVEILESQLASELEGVSKRPADND
ncbi:Uncharacterised protein [BD1-7 clade bacterium]|uniref:Glycosyltransferase n=1 Tax=BD1-7 clade bacterium TaxID=2029982 RepID=A0A5S9QZI6_9GAMM|nr:Uncharacterised protein [BD1-7 clade bacterium]